ncbi:MAG: diaminopimelate decarboxylase [Chloroflexota bacterium]
MSHTMSRLPLFPDTTKIKQDALTIAGQDLAVLADKYGTPLYLYDQATLDNAVACYRDALASSYPGPASVTYAGKAWLSVALAQWTQRHGLWLDCTGEGEIAIARAGGVAREHILVHGVNKSNADLEAAVRHAGTIVVDNLSELARLAILFPKPNSPFPHIWLRLQPGLAVDTHAYTQTGQHNSKFGMDGEELLEAALFCRERGLPLEGLHFHQGSQFRDPAPLRPAIERSLDFARQIGFSGAWHFSPGGGWGVAYHEDELPHPDAKEYVRVIVESVAGGCQALGLHLPHLHIEPGRSIAARAGVALYRVETVKRQDGRTWLLVDGGLADNPRHALYGARYSCLTVAGPGRERCERVHIAGPYCESGDVLIEDLPMPKVEAGELIAVPMSGAYQLSMSSNYNGARRPAVAWLGENGAQLIQRRETVEDLLRRDVTLPG